MPQSIQGPASTWVCLANSGINIREHTCPLILATFSNIYLVGDYNDFMDLGVLTLVFLTWFRIWEIKREYDILDPFWTKWKLFDLLALHTLFHPALSFLYSLNTYLLRALSDPDTMLSRTFCRLPAHHSLLNLPCLQCWRQEWRANPHRMCS